MLIHLIGFGSQGRAWAQNLRDSGWDVRIVLHEEGRSWKIAQEMKFLPSKDCEFRNDGTAQLVAFLCPDHLIPGIYQEHFAHLHIPLTFILAHGYAVYSKELQLKNPQHELALLAPKAIGPKLRAGFIAGGKTHSLVAAFHASSARSDQIQSLAQALGFKSENLAKATFEQEAVGDLMSEQGLLCGGVFTLLTWTVHAMREAGVPEKLIHEECLTELELIAGLLKEKGPAETFKAISQAAQCGTVVMKEALEKSTAREFFDRQLKKVRTLEFVDQMNGETWKKEREAFISELYALF